MIGIRTGSVPGYRECPSIYTYSQTKLYSMTVQTCTFICHIHREYKYRDTCSTTSALRRFPNGHLSWRPTTLAIQIYIERIDAEWYSALSIYVEWEALRVKPLVYPRNLWTPRDFQPSFARTVCTEINVGHKRRRSLKLLCAISTTQYMGSMQWSTGKFLELNLNWRNTMNLFNFHTYENVV